MHCSIIPIAGKANQALLIHPAGVKLAKKKKYYAVETGRVRGIYTEWYGDRGAEKQVRGYPGAMYKGFATLAAAEAFLIDKPVGKLQRRPGKTSTRAVHKPKVKAYRPGQVEDGKNVVYTDGGALSNPGPGGYGVVISAGGKIWEISKGYRLTTNNRMELMACIVGLRAFKKPASILLYSDAKYVINGITRGWAQKWQANGWMRTKTEPAINPDLWELLLKQCDKHNVEFRWVKGHAGIEGNERCDALATAAASRGNLPPDRGYKKSVKSER